ncbi:LmbE family N-acetylglucosaminyl deacetylase [Nakamurella sp. UYEF19]|uniref:PIG-L family deacetylase n=1 Tax=Nakamurella sp. UYEF19 TaxID=1756392 RepID=UPI0033984881
MVAPAQAPPFDHRDSGTAESVWAASDVLTNAAELDLTGVRRLVVVAAHPDDESLGAGGLIATAARSGIPVSVLIATLGERSHPDSPTHTRETLATLRRAEVFTAMGYLAADATVRLLGLPDGDLAEHRSELAAAIGEMITDPETVVVAPWIGDGHPDHVAAGQAASDASTGTGAVVLQYPIWAWHWSRPEDLAVPLIRLPLTAQDLEAKKTALQCHRSQTQPLSEQIGDEAIVTPAFTTHFERLFEIFVQEHVPGAAVPAGGLDGAPAPAGSLNREFFDEFYGEHRDPWGFESRWYETRKRAITMGALPRPAFRSGFEPGCSIGVLTEELAGRCDNLLATDIAAAPLRIAADRLAGTPGVRFEQRRIPQEWPSEQFDLVVLSEVGYYCGPEDLRSLAIRAAQALTPDGVLVACHWRHPVAEYPVSGDEVHRVLLADTGLFVLVEHVEADFVLHVLGRTPGASVAGATGLLG